MGASASVDLRPEEVTELQDITNYEQKEIKILYKRFRRLDRSGKGTISNDDLQMIPEIAMNPLSSRLTVLFERDSEDRINFKSFASTLATFSNRARPELKCRAVFRLFDVDGDGFVTRADLAKSMDLLVGTSISPQTRDEIIRRTIAEADADGDGRISFEDFSQTSLSTMEWQQFVVPIKSTSRWEAQESLNQSNSFTKLTEEPHGETH